LDYRRSKEDHRLPATDYRLEHSRRTWAEVDLGAVTGNYRTLASLLPPAADRHTRFPTRNPRIIPVIKAGAYGHGMIPVARALAAAGATMFAVGFVEEGLQLRRAGISQEILVLTTTWAGQEIEAIENRLILAADNADCLLALEAAAKKLEEPISIHLKVDTGMARLGVRWDSMEVFLRVFRQTSRILSKGVFTHLSSAEELDPSFTLEQIRRFECALNAIRESGMDCGEIHCANSAGLLYFENLRRWSIRAGIAVYGYAPAPQRSPVKLLPALCLKTRVGPIRSLEAGEPVGYNRKYVVSQPTRLTTLPVGYADGFNRRFGNHRKVIIQNRSAPVIGAVSMDMITVDLTDFREVREGDEVILLGTGDGCGVTAADWADFLETIPYEVLCGIAPRVPRIYIESD
jgi:alanine racemase